MAPLGAAAVANSVSALAFDDVWIVGSLSHPSGEERSFAQRFDGASWTSVPVPGIALTGVRSFSSTSAWAIGVKSVQGFVRTLAIHWDGSSWHEVSTPNANNSTNIFLAIGGSSSDDVWAVGWYFDPNDHKTLTLAEHWNGSAWSLAPTPNVDLQNELLGVYVAAPNDAWAVGYHDDVGGTDGDVLIEHWNGSSWSVARAPSIPFAAYAALSSIDGSSPDDIWAVGLGYSSSSSPSSTLTIHWNGSQWSYVRSPNVGSGANLLNGVAGSKLGGAVAVGSSASGASTLVERWNGSKWFVDTSSLSPKYSQLNGVSIGPRGIVWAAGYASTEPFDEFGCSW